MIRLLLFFKKIHVVLFFLLIEVVCIVIFFNHNPYQRAAMVSASNVVVGGIHGKLESVGNYFSLLDRNEALLAENARLMGRLSAYAADTTKNLDSLSGLDYKVVKVVRNTYTKADNFITINAGTKQGISPEMALFSTDGIVGYVLACSANFSVAISVLNHSDFHTSGQIKGTNFTGSIAWDGIHYRRLKFDDVPKYAKMEIGDTVETTQLSSIFPEGIPIGVIEKFEIVNGTFYTVDLKMLADMSGLDYLYAVSLKGQQERAALENQYIPE